MGMGKPLGPGQLDTSQNDMANALAAVKAQANSGSSGSFGKSPAGAMMGQPAAPTRADIAAQHHIGTWADRQMGATRAMGQQPAPPYGPMMFGGQMPAGGLPGAMGMQPQGQGLVAYNPFRQNIRTWTPQTQQSPYGNGANYMDRAALQAAIQQPAAEQAASPQQADGQGGLARGGRVRRRY